MIYAEKEYDIPEMRWAYDPSDPTPRRLLVVWTPQEAQLTAYRFN